MSEKPQMKILKRHAEGCSCVTTGRLCSAAFAPLTPRIVPDPDDDLRRLALGMLAMLKRRFPNDWRRMVQEINEAKAA
jgi:hypothetical protein